MQNNNGPADVSNHETLIPVEFEFTHPTAETVCIAGSFNEWHPWQSPLKRGYGGRWTRATSLSPGRYEYCLVMDGKWILDPLNQVSVSNPFGGRNSVMTVALSDQQKHMMDAEQAPLLNAYETKREQNRNRLDAVSNKMELAGKGPKWRAIMDLMAATEARPQTLQ